MIAKAPNKYPTTGNSQRVFLAGTIEMGKSVDWQTELGKKLDVIFKDDVIVLDPRRTDWDASWEQKDGNLQFTEQVEWEQRALLLSHTIFFYFIPGTMSPVSLLELGQFLGRTNCIVCCPEGYWRKGNVDITCRLANVKVYNNYDEAVEKLIQHIKGDILQIKADKEEDDNPKPERGCPFIQ